MSRHVVAATQDIPPGARKLFTIKGRPIAIFNLDGAYFGLLNRCPHQGGSLCDGLVTGLLRSPSPGQYEYTRQGEILKCPWHGWEFDIRTGHSYCDPDKIKTKATPSAPPPAPSWLKARMWRKPCRCGSKKTTSWWRSDLSPGR